MRETKVKGLIEEAQDRAREDKVLSLAKQEARRVLDDFRSRLDGLFEHAFMRGYLVGREDELIQTTVLLGGEKSDILKAVLKEKEETS